VKPFKCNAHEIIKNHFTLITVTSLERLYVANKIIVEKNDTFFLKYFQLRVPMVHVKMVRLVPSTIINMFVLAYLDMPEPFAKQVS
jgi:hypothetical protein